MPMDLYYVPGSGPCRAVRLVAAAVGVQLNLKLTDLMAEDQLKPEFIKMNPQHTVPTLDDDGFYLSESRAICTYLIEKYGKADDSLYPKDAAQRAIINQRLYFDLGCLYQSFDEYFVFAGAAADAAKLQKCHEALDYLDKFLEKQHYVAADHLTVADLVLVVSASNFTIIDFDLSRHQNTVRWINKIKAEATNYEGTNGEGLKAFQALINQLMNK